MKTLNAHILTDESLTAVIDGQVFTMNHNHPSFMEAVDALADGAIDTLFDLFNVAATIVRKIGGVSNAGSVRIEGGTIFYKDVAVHNYVTDKIFEFMGDGLPFKPLVNFLEKVLANPSRRATEELYKFLEHKHLPITEDGDFLAYKGVCQDYMDLYSRKFSNHVGAVLEMPRNAVCDDADQGCSYGFHAGSYEYASGYARGGRLVIVKINPADVVSVPKDCDCQKLRTCRYAVVKDFVTPYSKPLTTEKFEKGQSNFYNVRDSKGRFVRKS